LGTLAGQRGLFLGFYSVYLGKSNRNSRQPLKIEVQGKGDEILLNKAFCYEIFFLTGEIIKTNLALRDDYE
jgi:hypothetical protein